MQICRASSRYVSVMSNDAPLRKRLREIARSRQRWGMRRLHVLLRCEGWHVNHKRVERLFREEGLQTRVKRRRTLVSLARCPTKAPRRRNERWTLDFVHDQLSEGRKLWIPTVIDVFSRQCVGVEVDFSLRSVRVTTALTQFIQRRGEGPKALTLDNGSEFRALHFDDCAYAHGIKFDFLRPRKPVENAFIESINGTLREECLNDNWFTDLADARAPIEAWRVDCNEVRPRSSLGNLPPAAHCAPRAAPRPVPAVRSLSTPRGSTPFGGPWNGDRSSGLRTLTAPG